MEERMIRRALSSLLYIVADAIDGVILPSGIISDSDKQFVETAQSLLFEKKDPVKGRAYLKSVFNKLNGNDGNLHYAPDPIQPDVSINYPIHDEVSCDYGEIAKRMNNCLEKLEVSEQGLHRLLETLETELTYIPGTLSESDVSLFDQAKICAALASCLPESIESISSSDELFLLYSMDFSGIQDFIYTINSKEALKTLRARSFYLEILMENIIDDLLDEVGLSRLNLIYSGGGHCYILMPNNVAIIDSTENFNRKINEWLLDKFDISLFVGHGYASCSGDVFRNIPDGSYSDLFRRVSRSISDQKANRYTSEQIIRINRRKKANYSRECRICRRVDELNTDDKCPICNAITDFSNSILNHGFFCRTGEPGRGLPMPDDSSIVSFQTAEDIKTAGCSISRVYRKRNIDSNIDSIGLLIGDYRSDRNTLQEMAEDAESAGRIKRIGVVRADVDNLGTAFSTGFKNMTGGNLLSTVALSKQLSLFFKCYINKILGDAKRNATICYSGGDDLFIVGEWYSVINLSVDLSYCFKRFTEETLSLSAGIGIYDCKYPISRIAYETAQMEDLSKHIDGKDAVTIFENNTYHWKDFKEKVIDEKLGLISAFFGSTNDRGTSFLYRLFELILNQNDRINFARFIYTLSRLEPGRDSPQEAKDNYREFSVHMIEWIKTEEDRKQLVTAIMLYVYQIRNKKEDESNGIPE